MISKKSLLLSIACIALVLGVTPMFAWGDVDAGSVAQDETDEAAAASAGDLVAGRVAMPVGADDEADAIDGSDGGDAGLVASGALDPDAAVETETIDIELHLIQAGDDYYLSHGTGLGAFGEVDGTSSSGILGAQHDENAREKAITRVQNRLNVGLENLEESIDVSGFGLTCEKSEASDLISELVSGVVNRNPDLFYVSEGMSYSLLVYEHETTCTVAVLRPSYLFDISAIQLMKENYETAMQGVLSWVPNGASDVQKAKVAHDWLVRNCVYDPYVYGNGSLQPTSDDPNLAHPKGWLPWTSYGALVSPNNPVCQGYSLAFIAIMNRLGVKATYVSDDTHGWNRVCADGTWYNVDVTHDDPYIYGTGTDSGFDATPRTTYFMKSDAWFKTYPSGSETSPHHTWWEPEGVAGDDAQYDEKTNWETYSAPTEQTPLASFSLSDTTMDMKCESSKALSITNVTPSSASTYSARWSSSDTSIATVSGSGLVMTGSKTGSVTITCTIGGVSQSCNVTVNVERSLENARMDVSPKQLTYNAASQTPSVDVWYRLDTNRELKLTENRHYSVVWPADTVNAGAKTIVVQGEGIYEGTSITDAYTINPRSIDEEVDVASPANVVYDGEEHKLSPTLSFDGATLVKGQDYTLRWPSADYTAAGTKTVNVVGKGNFTGTMSFEYQIEPAQISQATITGVVDKTYTGNAIKQDPEVSLGGVTLVEGEDYELSHSSNVNAGTASVIVAGKGNFTGSVTREFEIARKGIDGLTVNVTPPLDHIYTGEALKLEPSLYDSQADSTLLAGRDYTLAWPDDNYVDVGEKTVTITGTGNYKGTRTTTYSIGKVDLKYAQIELLESEFTYDRKAKEPHVKVIYDGHELREDEAYTLKYSNNVNAGWATVIITGVDDYTGIVEEQFYIAPIPVDAPSAVSFTYDGLEHACALAPEGAPYALAGNVAADAGDYTAVATLSDEANYRWADGGSAPLELPWSIVPKQVTVRPADAKKTYGAKDPALEASCEGCLNGDTVAFRVARDAGESVGTYAIRAVGDALQGNYRVTFGQARFAIEAAAISKARASGIVAKTYTGKKLAQAPKLTYAGKTLKAGTDYALVYRNNVKVGTATVTIMGKGNFKGSVAKTFKVLKAANPTVVTAKKVAVKYNKKRNVTVAVSKAFSVKKAPGKLTYKKVVGTSKISVAKNGKITVKKGLAKKQYSIKVKITCSGNSNYKSKTLTRTVKVTVK